MSRYLKIALLSLAWLWLVPPARALSALPSDSAARKHDPKLELGVNLRGPLPLDFLSPGTFALYSFNVNLADSACALRSTWNYEKTGSFDPWQGGFSARVEEAGGSLDTTYYSRAEEVKFNRYFTRLGYQKSLRYSGAGVTLGGDVVLGYANRTVDQWRNDYHDGARGPYDQFHFTRTDNYLLTGVDFSMTLELFFGTHWHLGFTNLIEFVRFNKLSHTGTLDRPVLNEDSYWQAQVFVMKDISLFYRF